MITETTINNSIKSIQEALGVEQTGSWDNETFAALKNFQMRAKLIPNGQPTVETITELLKRSNMTLQNDTITVDNSDLDNDATTDQSEDSLKITEHYLNDDQYNKDVISKFDYIFIHHTSGWDNPINVVKDWNSDQRGKIGVHYVIGGESINNTNTNDGVIVKCIPDYNWASHLGSFSKDGINFNMHKCSIGIELCNFGYLTRNANGDYLTYTNSKVNFNQVLDLGYKFRGYQYWHRYSDAQLKSLKILLKHLTKKFNIDPNGGLKSWLLKLSPDHYGQAFEYSPDATAGKVKGILSHTNVRKDKTDVYPHPQLIELLLNLD